MVAEVTGRSRRIVRKADRHRRRSPRRREPRRLGQSRRDARLSWMTTSASSSSPTPAAPGAAITPTCRRGTSACASITCSKPGWKADTAIQGLGRTNRTNQAQPPLFRPIATDVKGEKRFLSHHRPAPRHARRHHARPAPDRRPGPVPPRGQSRKPLCPRCAAPALHASGQRARSTAARFRRSRTRPA